MKTEKQTSQPSIKDAIRRALGFKALRTMRNMVDEIEREDLTDKKLLQALLITLPLILVLVVILIYFYSSSIIVQPIT
jgi:hypothetical protein